jgi:hypothetical protein
LKELQEATDATNEAIAPVEPADTVVDDALGPIEEQGGQQTSDPAPDDQPMKMSQQSQADQTVEDPAHSTNIGHSSSEQWQPQNEEKTDPQTGTQVSQLGDPSPSPPELPSIHLPTSSIYIRNFKRPLHIPTLREHISQLAQSSDSSDPIKTFYLDSVRTHAFITFTSVSAASRARAAMHEARFPDEPQREPLFADFIPENKVQEWIDQETGGGFGGGRSNRRWEVIYNNDQKGVTASLQDADSKPRPAMTQRSSINAKGSTSGVHPDREAFMPPEPRRTSQPERPRQPETGFKALDELYSHTTSKPKLYYKPAPSHLVADRLDLIKGLRLGHADLGKSGDEGMKRFSFEKFKGRDEWVDKGPEFGHGVRGQAILRGERPRGRGGGFRGGRGDSWRGR